MARHDSPPYPASPPPLGHPRQRPTYHFENYENGRAKWAPSVDNERAYRDYRDHRRDHRRSHKERERERDGDAPPPAAEREHRAYRPRPRRSYSISDSDSPPPLARPSRRSDRQEQHRPKPRPVREDTYDSYDEHYPPRRPRTDGRRDHEGYKSEGYKSDRYGRDRRDGPRDSRHVGRRDDLPEKSHRAPRYDDRRHRDRYDDRYRERSRSRGRRNNQPLWQQEALSMFKEYAVPIIKAEGGKFIAKQMANAAKKY